MNNPLFRRLAITAVLLVGAALFAIDATFTSFANSRSLDPAIITPVRRQIFLIGLGASIIGLSVAFAVSGSLTRRVLSLRHTVQTLPGGDAHGLAPAQSGDDLASLERSLAGVASELQRLLDRMTFETARRDAILSGMTEGVLAVDHDLRVTFCNESLLRAVGFRGRNYEGLGLLELVRDNEFYELMRSVVATSEPSHLRFRFAAASARVFQVQATPLDMPSGRGAIAIVHDTTELERLEQVRKDFVANVSHELRTPLAGVIGYADTLLEGALDDQQNRRRFVEIIRTNAVRLSNITSDLLVLSELESGVDPADREIISVRGVLEGAITTVHGEARTRGVELVRGVIDSVYVSGTRLRLEQAILNLLANAIKFNREGGEVHVTAALDSSGQVEIKVADTGVGIPSEDLPRIFERFYRVDKARSRQVGGTGLGLSIVKHVVERMNGVVRVESQLGKGTTFTILLPPVPESENREA